jgi:cytochrome c
MWPARLGIPLAVLALGAGLPTGLPQARYAATAADVPAATAFPGTIPGRPQGELIRYGRSLLTDTQKCAGRHISAGMSCSACHTEC